MGGADCQVQFNLTPASEKVIETPLSICYDTAVAQCHPNNSVLEPGAKTMNHRLTTIVSLLLVCLATLPVLAEGAGIEWDILNDEVKELYRGQI